MSRTEGEEGGAKTVGAKNGARARPAQESAGGPTEALTQGARRRGRKAPEETSRAEGRKRGGDEGKARERQREWAGETSISQARGRKKDRRREQRTREKRSRE